MKIDLHCHTKSTKIGENKNRNITPDKFVACLSNNQVAIAAITNHNSFDFEQYKEMNELCLENKIMLWPGAEVDVAGKESKGHIIVIANPDDVNEFEAKCQSLFLTIKPDEFCTDIDNLSKTFENVNVIFIAHYGSKKPSLSENDLLDFRKLIENKKPLLFETSNLLSAGILYAHNVDSFIGSDVKDWNQYNTYELPELKMDILDFNHFCLLLKKDTHAIKTFLNQKKNITLNIDPFDDCHLALPIYNDVNIIFGGKGTGKSVILDNIRKEIELHGNSDVSYYNAQQKTEDYKKLVKIENRNDDFDKFGIDDCLKEFNNIINWKDSQITPTSKYFDWANNKSKSKLSEIFGFRNMTFGEDLSSERYDVIANDVLVIEDITKKIETMDNGDYYLSKEEKSIFKSMLVKMLATAKSKKKNEWIRIEALKLEKFTIQKMKELCTNKTGTVTLPISTGILDLFNNCISLKNEITKIHNALELNNIEEKILIGEVPDKGNVYLKRIICVNTNDTNLVFPSNKKANISELREIKKKIGIIEKNVFSDSKNDYLQELNTILEENEVLSLRDFIGVKGYVCNSNDDEYKPSNGEESILLLTNALIDNDKNYFILDEPEMSLGHKYINDIIVGKILNLARQNKTIIISTHDANIAVRTLPLTTIYREYSDNEEYKTYIGNPFMDELINVKNHEDKYSWTKKSVEMLEGGEQAFAERNSIYDL